MCGPAGSCDQDHSKKEETYETVTWEIPSRVRHSIKQLHALVQSDHDKVSEDVVVSFLLRKAIDEALEKYGIWINAYMDARK